VIAGNVDGQELVGSYQNRQCWLSLTLPVFVTASSVVCNNIVGWLPEPAVLVIDNTVGCLCAPTVLWTITAGL